MSSGLSLLANDELPKGWAEVSLREFRREKSTIFNPDNYADETVELYSIPSHEFGTPEIVKGAEIGSSKQFVQTGDVLLSKINPRINRAWVVGDFSRFQKVASTEWVVFEKSNAVIPVLLKYLVTEVRIRDYLSHNASGVGGSLTRIKPSLVDTILVGLPPLNEQHRIVAKIEALFSELDKGIEALKTTREQLKVYRQAVLKHAFEGKLTAQWREENKDKLESHGQLLDRIQQEQTGNNDVLPGSWVVCTVKEILSYGPSNGRSVKDRKDGFPVLRLTALKAGKIDLSERKNGDWERDAAEQYIVQPGDFLLSRGNGSKHLVGRGGIVPEYKGEVAFPDTMVRLRINPEIMHVEYFSLVWQSRLMRDQIESSARTTAGIYKINQRHIEGFVVPVPGLLEQAAVVAQVEEKLSNIDQQELEIDKALLSSEILRQSILKKAFSGQLVPQDPNDEPAAVLLERILAEKAAQAKGGARAGRSGKKKKNEAA